MKQLKLVLPLLASALVLAAPADAADRLSRADKAFLAVAAQSGQAEVEAGRLAGRRAADGGVKAFAAKMVEDHAKVGSELQQLAGTKGVKLPDKPSLVQRASVRSLGTLEGRKFDEYYSRDWGVKAHENTILAFRSAIDKAEDADVKAFAQKTLPALEQHLEMARALKRETGPANPGSAPTPGR